MGNSPEDLSEIVMYQKLHKKTMKLVLKKNLVSKTCQQDLKSIHCGFARAVVKYFYKIEFSTPMIDNNRRND